MPVEAKDKSKAGPAVTAKSEVSLESKNEHGEATTRIRKKKKSVKKSMGSSAVDKGGPTERQLGNSGGKGNARKKNPNGSVDKKSDGGPSGNPTKTAIAPKKPGKATGKAVQYWCEPTGVGNIWLREALGGLGSDLNDGDEWEFMDVAVAFASFKKKMDMQNVYNHAAGALTKGETYVDIADSLNIPDRVFVVPMLLAAFDKAVQAGTIISWQPDSAGLETHADFEHIETETEKEAIKAGLPKPRAAKNWDDIAKQAGVRKSSACTIS